MNIIFSSYFLLIPFFCYALALTLILFLASYFFIPRLEDNEKLSPYECGFDPFEDTRTTFDVKYYLVSILFIIFDLEIVLLFPWSISVFYINILGFSVVILFLLILTLGFFYEWALGALDWD